jgi:hypothetical protein
MAGKKATQAQIKRLREAADKLYDDASAVTAAVDVLDEITSTDEERQSADSAVRKHLADIQVIIDGMKDWR